MTKAKISTNKKQIIAFLAQTEFFSNEPIETIQEIADSFTVINIAGKEVLFNQGDTPDGLYFLMFGFLCITLKSSSGIEKIIGELSP